MCIRDRSEIDPKMRSLTLNCTWLVVLASWNIRNQKGGITMPKFVIERDIPGAVSYTHLCVVVGGDAGRSPDPAPACLGHGQISRSHAAAGAAGAICRNRTPLPAARSGVALERRADPGAPGAVVNRTRARVHGRGRRAATGHRFAALVRDVYKRQ